MGKTSNLDGLILTPQLFRRGRWGPVHDIRHLTGTGVAGIGGRSLVSVRIYALSVFTLLLTNMLMIGPLLLKNLLEAVDMVKQCESACADFEQHRAPDVIHEWKMMKLRWEKDSSQPDPFKLVERGVLVI